MLGAGGLADSVVLTEDLARVTKAVVDPGSNAEDTPDTTATVLAGNTVDFVLRPTLTNGLADGRPTAMTVRDVLPITPRSSRTAHHSRPWSTPSRPRTDRPGSD